MRDELLVPDDRELQTLNVAELTYCRAEKIREDQYSKQQRVQNRACSLYSTSNVTLLRHTMTYRNQTVTSHAVKPISMREGL